MSSLQVRSTGLLGRCVAKRTQDAFDLGLVARALCLEPLQYVLIEPQRDCGLVGNWLQATMNNATDDVLDSPSGCSAECLPAMTLFSSLDQSVLDVLEVVLRITSGCFAEGDVADFIIVLRMSDGNRNPSQQSDGYEPLLAVAKPVIFISERGTLEDTRVSTKPSPWSLTLIARLRSDQVNSIAKVHIRDVVASSAA